MNLDDFSYEQEDRRYINPQVGLDESNAFIESLRETQAQNTAGIQQDTYNLGTQVPSNLGGLVGGEGYFKARYQTPQTNALVADLRAAAQAQALNEAMSNELAQAKQRYNNAYKAASKRRARSSGGGGGGTTTTNPTTTSGLPDNVTETPATTASNFWSLSIGGKVGNQEVANYGLYQLKRNPGESQSEWENRVLKWHAELDAKNAWRGYNTMEEAVAAANAKLNKGK